MHTQQKETISNPDLDMNCGSGPSTRNMKVAKPEPKLSVKQIEASDDQIKNDLREAIRMVASPKSSIENKSQAILLEGSKEVVSVKQSESNDDEIKKDLKLCEAIRVAGSTKSSVDSNGQAILLEASKEGKGLDSGIHVALKKPSKKGAPNEVTEADAQILEMIGKLTAQPNPNQAVVAGEIEVQELPNSATAGQAQTAPGAYLNAPGTTPQRIPNPCFAVGGHPTGPPAALPSNRNTLVEANPVEELEGLEDARVVDAEQAKQKREKQNKQKKNLLGLLVLVCIIIAVTVPAIIGIKKKDPETEPTTVVLVTTDSPTASPTRQLPPLKNLEILYREIPENTRESLFDNTSPQYVAWSFLHNHQNITNLPEWRKKQVFAMATFFYSFEGPKWPVSISQNWVNESLSECSWINTDLNLLMGLSIQYLGTDSFDFRPCNDAGEIQTIAMLNMQLEQASPFIPPEISLLSSMSILVLTFSGIAAPLEEMLRPEVIHLPHLSLLSFYDNQLTGTIPPQISAMTSLRNCLIGSNLLSSTIPTEFGALTKLQQLELQRSFLTGTIPSQLGLLTLMSDFELYTNSLSGSIPSELGNMAFMGTMSIYENPSINGHIPSELGLMSTARSLLLQRNELSGSLPSEVAMLTKLTSLGLGTNSLSGLVPTELGSLTSMSFLSLHDNLFSGGIPSELGMLSDMVGFLIYNNTMTGSIPSELGLISNLTQFRIHNNSLSGAIPEEIWQLSQLKEFEVTGLPLLSGVIPEELCPLQESECVYDVSSWGFTIWTNLHCTLGFDCTEKLCGCDCSCESSIGNHSSLRGRK